MGEVWEISHLLRGAPGSSIAGLSSLCKPRLEPLDLKHSFGEAGEYVHLVDPSSISKHSEAFLSALQIDVL